MPDTLSDSEKRFVDEYMFSDNIQTLAIWLFRKLAIDPPTRKELNVVREQINHHRSQ